MKDYRVIDSGFETDAWGLVSHFVVLEDRHLRQTRKQTSFHFDIGEKVTIDMGHIVNEKNRDLEELPDLCPCCNKPLLDLNGNFRKCVSFDCYPNIHHNVISLFVTTLGRDIVNDEQFVHGINSLISRNFLREVADVFHFLDNGSTGFYFSDIKSIHIRKIVCDLVERIELKDFLAIMPFSEEFKTEFCTLSFNKFLTKKFSIEKQRDRDLYFRILNDQSFRNFFSQVAEKKGQLKFTQVGICYTKEKASRKFYLYITFLIGLLKPFKPNY